MAATTTAVVVVAPPPTATTTGSPASPVAASLVVFEKYLDLSRFNRGGQQDQYIQFFDPDGELFETRDISRPELEQEIVLNASGGWSFDNGDLLNLNLRIAEKEEEEREHYDYEKDRIGDMTEHDFEKLTMERATRVEMDKAKEAVEKKMATLQDHITFLEEGYAALDD